jgi:hypothetical protein
MLNVSGPDYDTRHLDGRDEHDEEWYERRVVRRVCALCKTVNDMMAKRSDDGERRFLAHYPADLLHDGFGLWALRHEDKLAWMIYDCGTHLLHDAAGVERITLVWGDNRTDPALQWFKLVEIEPDVARRDGNELGKAEWVECSAAEALAMWAE